jgi:hypothetical protein
MAGKRRRRREDYKRWERGRAMEWWQMDVVGRIHLADGTELAAVTGIDECRRDEPTHVGKLGVVTAPSRCRLVS